jgi:LuxR family maltose regulon positive regulatory protein
MLARSAFPKPEAIAHARLVLVNGPAGFGKTTALCQYERVLRESGVATCWLTLDADDNDLARFTSCLHASLARGLPAVAAVAQRDASAVGDRGAVLAQAFDVIDAIASDDRALAVFFDDFEKIVDDEVRGVVTRLLLTLGPRQQLVIGTRAIPDLGLARLRASGQLAEIGQGDLRFTPEESRRFLLEVLASGMSIEDAAFLHERSEGWPAALQLAALAFGGEPGSAGRLREFGGSLAQVADYLAAEMLTRLPEDLRDFLLKTSILDNFCAELCDEVTGQPGGAEMIARIGRANLFLVALDGDARWFRYHSLAAEFLRNRLAETQASAIPELRRRAARWLAANGRYATALEQAQGSGDAELSLAIFEQCATQWLHEGRTTTVARSAEAIPAERLATRPELHFTVALANIVSHRYAEAQRLIEAIGGDAARRRDLAMLSFNLVIWSDRLQNLREALNQAVATLSPADGFVYSSMLNCVGYLGFLEGSAEMARSGLAAAKASPSHRDNEVVRTYSEGQAAMIHLTRGELADAEQVAGAELDRLAEAGRHYGTSGAIVSTVLADALYERNDLASARVLLDEHLDIAEDTCIPDLIISAFLARSRIARIEGDLRLADELTSRLQRVGERRGLVRLVAAALLEKARVALAEGRLDTAAAHTEAAAAYPFWNLAPFNGTFGNDLENREVGRARLELFRGATGAVPRLEAEISAAEAIGRTRRALKLRGLLAQALWLSGQRRPALRQLALALAAAAPEGLLRTLADEPWVLPDMLENADLGGDPRLTSFAKKLAAACGPSAATARGSESRPASAGVLSRREIEVLGLLARGHSNKEMARELSRSEATVATHLRRIYEKLGAHTRTQAIAIARRSGLIV